VSGSAAPNSMPVIVVSSAAVARSHASGNSTVSSPVHPPSRSAHQAAETAALRIVPVAYVSMALPPLLSAAHMWPTTTTPTSVMGGGTKPSGCQL